MSREEPPKDPDYVRRHNAVYNARGSATEHKCTDCSDKAVDWSQVHGTSGENPRHYLPRCRTCHRRYDLRRRRKK